MMIHIFTTKDATTKRAQFYTLVILPHIAIQNCKFQFSLKKVQKNLLYFVPFIPPFLPSKEMLHALHMP